ncbi:putative glycosyltransferase Hoc1p [[Candida] railenensis]|uniref:Glycosyltransferase Hoc1p n=1 Tax=[Candida] railenensis TaxID=45579 RepID=A0A9P0VXG1_9ASCO|nr:putative glycosyltransferase Hoc1p [[Candida] railenensis]
MAKNKRPIIIFVFLIVVLYIFINTLKVTNAHRTATELNSKSLSNSQKQQLELEKFAHIKKYGFNFQLNNKARLPDDATLRQQLAYQFPYEPKKPFPKNIWQTWKVTEDDETFPKNYKSYSETWKDNNPTYKRHVLSDEMCLELINQLYSTVPDVTNAYNSMPKNILKADFFRYLILFARGGVYSDIDTVGLKSIDVWPSLNETMNGEPNTAGIVVGIEADPDREDWHDWYARRVQFCQWTIQSKSGHPLLRELIAQITNLTLTRKKNGQLRKVLGKDEGGDIMDWTGPGIWTDYVFSYMNNVMQPQENFKNKVIDDDVVTWKMFTGMTSPILVDDVLVLPITSFSPDVGQMGAKTSKHKWALAKHMFSGSWKPEEERM